MKKNIKIGKVVFGRKLVMIAGVCSIENENQVLKTASFLKQTCAKHDIPLIFKASFDKANRLSIKSYRGPGIKKGLEIISKVKKKLNLPALVDVHCVTQINEVKKVADIIQIPAFLSRQTDLIVEAAKTNLPINIKKGQFLSPYDMKYIAEKAVSTGNKKIILTERGTSFGYGNLVVDFRSILIMRKTGFPVVFDATHSVQLPGGGGGKTAGQREFVLPLAKAAVAVGVDGIFLEVHPRPEKAKSDSGSVLGFGQFKKIAEFLSTKI
ncbi:MAG: 3-deoxy-8-phosphooctulonate synthase [Elusimicrobia bacterium]|nr:3-deoxy-8-phosphooctulonate synthase [Elusimicrobiota bacterium]